MFFNATLKSDWFYIHKISRYLMIVLLVAVLVMPILYQPPKSEAILPIVGAVAAIVAVDVVLLVVLMGQDKPCEVCSRLVPKTTEHEKPCPNCGELIFMCVTPNSHQNTCRSCGDLFYACDKPGVPEKDEQRYEHREVDSDCGKHKHQACTPENNHKNTPCDDCGTSHFECADCPPPPQGSGSIIIYAEDEDPAEGIIENNYDSSGCCDDSSGCCDDGS